MDKSAKLIPTWRRRFSGPPLCLTFFSPTYTQPGVVQQAGLVSPEFDIIYETTITNAQNMIYTGIYANYNTDGSPKLTGTGFRGDAYGSDVYLNFSASGSTTCCHWRPRPRAAVQQC